MSALKHGANGGGGGKAFKGGQGFPPVEPPPLLLIVRLKHKSCKKWGTSVGSKIQPESLGWGIFLNLLPIPQIQVI